MSISSDITDLRNLPVFLSASLPEELVETHRALDLEHFIATFVRELLADGGHLVFGGHPSVTPLVQHVAQEFDDPTIDLYQLPRFRKSAPPEIYEPEFSLHWVDADDLATMRDEMIGKSGAAVFVGGKTSGFTGEVPGIRDEYQRFKARHPDGPTYVLGLLDGEAYKLIQEINGHPGPDCLTERERKTLQETTSVDLAASLVLSGLHRAAQQKLTQLETPEPVAVGA